MFGIFSYFFSTIFLAVPIILTEWIFFYHILKRNTFPILISIIFGLLIVSISEPLGIYLQVWEFGVNETFTTFPLGVKLESYIYVLLGSIAVSSITIIYSTYQDMGIRNIFIQGLKDLFSGNYAFWKNGYGGSLSRPWHISPNRDTRHRSKRLRFRQ
ncbi:hypothetical protein HYW55_06270 [Candidatus Gottesmanbacteria bacterium]|nr:hypothetical protein [Candidatus Gottesmanbacteria bacterium]